MSNRIVLGVPSKGRLMEETLQIFAKCGMPIEKQGDERGYRGAIAGVPEVDVEFLSAGEIARDLKAGRVHLGVTGEDLIREQIPDADTKIEFLCKLGFGQADVVIAVPECWIDVDTVADFEEAAVLFAREHSRQMRIATKYPLLTRTFLTTNGVLSYRTVESLGATEGAPAAGTAEAIVDITTTGATLKANSLKILADGLILKSEANLVASKASRDDANIKAIAAALSNLQPNRSKSSR